jgi:hypothetical protein
MWHHFVNLLYQSGHNFLTALGTTGLGWWVQGIIWFFATEAATYLVVWRIRGTASMRSRLAENFRIGLYAWILVMVCIYGPIFGWHVVRAVYDDHQSLVAQVSRFRSAECPPSAQGGDQYPEIKREIQNKLSSFLAGENKIRDEWRIAMGQPDKTIQTTFASKAKQKHSEIDTYLRTIPRGSLYSARFNGYPRTVCAGYPLGHADEVCRELETLEADTNALGEFIKDPDLGRP